MKLRKLPDSVPKERRLEIITNLLAKSHTPSEEAAIGEYLEPFYRKDARKRQSTCEGKSLRKNFSKGDVGRATDQVAKILGKSRVTYEKMKGIVHSGQKDFVEEMDRTGKIDRIYGELQGYLKRKEKVKRAKEFTETPEAMVRLGDFREICKEIPDNSIHAIATDPPWGKEYLPIWEDLAVLAERVLVPGGWLICYAGTMYLDHYVKTLSKHLRYYWKVISLHDTGDRHYHRKFRNCHRDVLIYYKPPEKEHDGILRDVLTRGEKEKWAFKWQQSEDELKAIFEAFTKPGDKILNPMAGSGSIVVCAHKLKRRVIAIDINEKRIEEIRGRLAEVQNRPTGKPLEGGTEEFYPRPTRKDTSRKGGDKDAMAKILWENKGNS